MKQFDKAEKEFQPVEPGGTFLNRREERKFFFKAGLVAAADIASDDTSAFTQYEIGRRDAAELIRIAADEMEGK